MADIISSKENKWQHYLFILIIANIVFWPLTFGVFSLKNDAFIYFLPFRYHISEAIQQGYFPFWDPHLYTGLPLHSDMQSGSWNPVVLVISLFTRYNMQVLQWELLVYIFLAGAGMYNLIRQTGYSSGTAIVGAVSYMCCGFITDSGSFIPWVTSAAWLPFIFTYYYGLLKTPGLSTSLKLSLFLFLLLSAGYPAFFIYTVYILFAAFIYWLILNLRQKKNIRETLKYLLYTSVFFLLVASPLLLSFAEFLPYYSRGKGATLAQALFNPFDPFCSISYFLPSAVSKPHEWINTDLAMRNAFVGIFTITLFFVSFGSRMSSFRKFIAGLIAFSFIFSLGDATPLRKWCYHLLPYMDSFRHPGIIRLFTSIGIILLTAKTIEDFWEKKNRKKVKRAVIFTIILVMWSTGYYYIKDTFTPAELFSKAKTLKQFLDNLRFSDIAIIQGLIQLVFLTGFLALIRKNKAVFLIMIFNAIIFAWMALPFTFVSQASTKTIDNYLNAFTQKSSPPALTDSIDANTYTGTAADTEYGYSKFYNQKITIQDNVISPTLNTDYKKFLEDSLLRQKLDKMPLAYISSKEKFIDSSAVLSLEKLSPLHFRFTVIAPAGGYLNLFQQYHHNWKSNVNTRPVMVEKSNIAFMRVAVPPGRSYVEFRYIPRQTLLITMYLSAFIMTGMIFYLLLLYYKKMRRYS